MGNFSWLWQQAGGGTVSRFLSCTCTPFFSFLSLAHSLAALAYTRLFLFHFSLPSPSLATLARTLLSFHSPSCSHSFARCARLHTSFSFHSLSLPHFCYFLYCCWWGYLLRFGLLFRGSCGSISDIFSFCSYDDSVYGFLAGLPSGRPWPLWYTWISIIIYILHTHTRAIAQAFFLRLVNQ